MPDHTEVPSDTDVPSPCVGICMIDDAGLCFGCLRTVDELQRWWTASNEEKREILRRCEERR